MSEDIRPVPLTFLQEMREFLQHEFPMVKVRGAVEALERLIANTEPKEQDAE